MITVRNNSCGKVSFHKRVSRILSTWGGGCTPPRADTPPPETATAADGTHPIGMHSCNNNKIII